MCLAIIKKENQLIPYENIRIAWKQNSDGAGLCFREDGQVRIIKGFMQLDEFINFLCENEAIFTPIELVIHLRFSTSGTIKPELTHPFPTAKNNEHLTSLDCYTDQAIIHNGVMFSPIFKDYSDTAIFSRWMSFNPSFDAINRVVQNDRLVLFSHDDTITIGQWHEIDGNLYSNLYSLESKKSYYDDYNFMRYDSFLGHACPNCENEDCESIGIESEIYECLDCGTVFSLDGQMIFAQKRKSSKYDDYLDDSLLTENDFKYYLKKSVV
jgi:hypothetical protein